MEGKGLIAMEAYIIQLSAYDVTSGVSFGLRFCAGRKHGTRGMLAGFNTRPVTI